MTINRRSFLRRSGAGIGAAAAAAALGRWTRVANASSTSRYAGHRSLVAVFLLGGNDGNNMLVARDSRYDDYAAARPTIKLAKTELLPLTTAFGLHPAMPKLAAAFGAATPTASLVMTVGPVALPTLKADYDDSAFQKPTNLFSHSDQQDAWATAVPVPGLDAAHARTGWGGRTGDAIENLNPLVAGVTYPAVTLVGGRRSYAAGAGTPLVTSASGDLSFNPTTDNPFYDLRRGKLSEIAGVTAGSLQTSYGEELATSTAIAAARTAARDAAWASLRPATTTAIDGFFVSPNPAWLLPAQLYTVIKDIVAGAIAPTAGLGLKRQVFSVGFGSFDTHSGQRAIQDDLLAQLDFSLEAFRLSMTKLATEPVFAGFPPQSTLFTMSDFARTFTENSNNGTDHAWGNHMIVMGSRVDGGKLWGVFPDTALATSQDTTDSRGRWLPTTSVEQYVSNLASWLGVNTTELAEILPNRQAYADAATARGLSSTYTRLQYPIMVADS